MSIRRAIRSLTICLLCCTCGTAAIGKKSDKLNVMVDERMELLSTIQYLAGYPILSPAKTRYKTEVAEYFKNYREHNAVTLYKTIYRRFFGYDAPPVYMVHMSFPDLKQNSPFSWQDQQTYEFNKNRDTLNLLMKEFRDFYQKTEFHKFYKDHEKFYESLVKPIQDKLSGSDIIDIIEEHYGRQNKEYNIILSPLLHDGGYGPQVRTSEGPVLYAIIGPRHDSKETPVFDVDNLIADYILHEFSHSFCNPMIARNMGQLAKDSCLLTPIKTALEEQGYGNWEGCLYEHMVRANEIVLTEKVFGKEKADEAREAMIKNDQWIYLDGLIPIITQYQENRKKYKTEDMIMPLVVRYFDEKAKECMLNSKL